MGKEGSVQARINKEWHMNLGVLNNHYSPTASPPAPHACMQDMSALFTCSLWISIVALRQGSTKYVHRYVVARDDRTSRRSALDGHVAGCTRWSGIDLVMSSQFRAGFGWPIQRWP